ncbi:hypothetical protein like AT1G43760 [Hibiscus trionum]|uniref:Reverse transcriptase n=1 Tax=Hibiscus trionum TaxID=183268 RepID=A0A9W7HCU2_HIBTR|nr:hypothetical protein like AT1G43760 [Hibiscus trionum]
MLRLNNDAWCDDPSVLKAHAITYFSELFTTSSRALPREDFCDGFSRIPHERLYELIRVVTLEEVRDVVFSMDPFKASGADGFQTVFFQRNWSTVGESVHRFAHDFFTTRVLPDDANRTLLVLIPKVPNPEKISQFRPIGLCTVLYKVVTKILVNRLKPFLSDWNKAWMAINVDLEKAYDRLE